MARDRFQHWLQRLLDMPNESLSKTIFVALTVSLVCSFIVSTAAVLLRPLQDSNRENERQQEILKIVNRLPGIEELFQSIDTGRVEARVVELATGNYVRAIDPADYDQRAAARNPQLSIEIPPGRDIARIKRRARYATVYIMKREEETKLIILPVHGGGYASTLYGFLALEGNANTVVALSFYEHGETPGMGARIDSAEWRGQWQGKKLYDEQGRLRIGVAKGPVDLSSLDFAYQVDGLTGATRTGDGVTNLLRFWLGDYGFGPYLNRFRF